MNIRMVAAIMILFIAAAEKLELLVMKLTYVTPEAITFQENKYLIVFLVGMLVMMWAVVPLDREDNL